MKKREMEIFILDRQDFSEPFERDEKYCYSRENIRIIVFTFNVLLKSKSVIFLEKKKKHGTDDLKRRNLVRCVLFTDF